MCWILVQSQSTVECQLSIGASFKLHILVIVIKESYCMYYIVHTWNHIKKTQVVGQKYSLKQMFLFETLIQVGK